MMTSNLLSRLLPTNTSGRSIYDDLRAHDGAAESDADIEERAGMAIDEENLGYHDDELGNADAFNGEDSRITTESIAFLARQTNDQRDGARAGPSRRNKAQRGWFAQSPRLLEEDGDDDVPASLLIEGNDRTGPNSPSHTRGKGTKASKRQSAIPGPSNRDNRAHWEAAQAKQMLHQDDQDRASSARQPEPTARLLTGSPRDKAMWMWINVVNLDNFMQQVYTYYTGSGIWCILLLRVLNLLTIIFVAIFVTFLSQCVDYSKIPKSTSLSQVVYPQCTKNISGMPNVAIWLFTLWGFGQIWLFLVDMPRLWRLHDFFLYLLEIPDSDLQTVSWQEVVARLMALRDQNPITVEKITPANRKYIGNQSKQRLDAHDIANRLMRRENYFIALFNKEVLDLTLPLPFLQGRQLFSRTLYWNLNWCIMDFIFNPQNQVNQLILKDSHRRQLSEGLRNRFLFAAFMNIIFAPLIVTYLLTVYFLKYFNEYQKNPASIGARQYTPLAEWKFREFNEVYHLYEKRANMSYPFASRYLEQFPKRKMGEFARFVGFVAGSLTAVLFLVTLWDHELFLSFEITPGRTAVFYIAIFGGLWGFMNGMTPDENLVFDPEYALRNVIDYTHYMPNHWQDRLHSDEIRKEFAELYQLKIMVFLNEVLSILITPFILWFSLPKCSDQIIDFFREFTVHVDGVGYVCSFAVFDFKKGVGKSGPQAGANSDPRDDYYSTKHGKMAASYYGFLDNYHLNPKTGVPGHIPPGLRHQFNPPPAFPGLMSPTLAADMQVSRMGRSERPRSRAPGAAPQSARTPRFAPAAQASPMPSMLLDPHHQPSTSGFGGRSIRRNSRPRYQAPQNIIEEPIEDEDETGTRGAGQSDPYESAVGLDESRWETSPTRGVSKETSEEEGDGGPGGGVLGLLYQFQKAQTDGRPGVSI